MTGSPVKARGVAFWEPPFPLLMGLTRTRFRKRGDMEAQRGKSVCVCVSRLGVWAKGWGRGPHLREEFICSAFDSILAPMSSMPLPLRSTLARQVLLPRALMRMLVRSFNLESATDNDCRDWRADGGWGQSSLPPPGSSLLGLVTHTVLLLDQLHQLMKDFFQSPVGSRGQRRRGGGQGHASRGDGWPEGNTGSHEEWRMMGAGSVDTGWGSLGLDIEVLP